MADIPIVLTRIAILRKKAEQDRMKLDAEITALIARRDQRA
ncbi:MAG: hypothetical protein Q8S73_15410 [Deltaproteobacteria bacterium]|nr:hypothetical protein [Myxococcales bacterium]MDP3215494.1 hypothetical protein [Deltaproteobacteria bacterium]